MKKAIFTASLSCLVLFGLAYAQPEKDKQKSKASDAVPGRFAVVTGTFQAPRTPTDTKTLEVKSAIRLNTVTGETWLLRINQSDSGRLTAEWAPIDK